MLPVFGNIISNLRKRNDYHQYSLLMDVPTKHKGTCSTDCKTPETIEI